jgi:hypothetical protein
MLVALVLFSLIAADTPLWRTMLVMLLMGLGLGGNMQPMVLAVQNAASPREIGVSTSSVAFFRSMGGTLGAAIFLSVLFSTAAAKVASAYTDAGKTPAFQQAALAHPDQLALLRSANLQDTSFLNKLDPALARPFKVGFSNAVDHVFLYAISFMVVGLIVVLFLPELPLRQRSAAQERESELNAAVG